MHFDAKSSKFHRCLVTLQLNSCCRSTFIHLSYTRAKYQSYSSCMIESCKDSYLVDVTCSEEASVLVGLDMTISNARSHCYKTATNVPFCSTYIMHMFTLCDRAKARRHGTDNSQEITCAKAAHKREQQNGL